MSQSCRRVTSEHFLTLTVKCSETTVLDLSLWHQDGWRHCDGSIGGSADRMDYCF